MPFGLVGPRSRRDGAGRFGVAAFAALGLFGGLMILPRPL